MRRRCARFLRALRPEAVPSSGELRSCNPSSSKRISSGEKTASCFQAAAAVRHRAHSPRAPVAQTWRNKDAIVVVQVRRRAFVIWNKGAQLCAIREGEVDLVGLSGGDALAYFGNIGVKLRRRNCRCRCGQMRLGVRIGLRIQPRQSPFLSISAANGMQRFAISLVCAVAPRPGLWFDDFGVNAWRWRMRGRPQMIGSI